LQRIEGVKNEKGVRITPAFPKLIYVLDEDNISPKSKYYYLTELAAKCTAKRMVPDYISAKVMKRLKGDVYACMGCRSFLTPSDDHKYYGRFNHGVTTINLVDVACSADSNEEKFWELLDERCELCFKALMCRHNRLKGTPSDVAPILWQYGALARLENGETIDKLLYNNYSTISLGYAGIAEMTYRMKGCSHTEPEGKEFALAVMRFLNDKCADWKVKTNISFSLYGTPMESVTYKFAQCLQRHFGIISHVTDKSYITNSYHVHVTEPIDAFSKLKFEAEFQELSPGGAISYVEVPNLQNNIPAVLSVMQFIYENIMYAELNTKSDYCQACGFDGEISIVEEDGKLIWECPNCGNRDQRTMNVCRRTCGYLGTQYWNQGRTAEIKDRVMHL
jgi:ribonucleoside-triphosphate reductase